MNKLIKETKEIRRIPLEIKISQTQRLYITDNSKPDCVCHQSKFNAQSLQRKAISPYSD